MQRGRAPKGARPHCFLQRRRAWLTWEWTFSLDNRGNLAYNALMTSLASPFIMGTRGSELALCQAQLALDALVAAHGSFPHEIRTIRTAGDAHTDIPLSEVNRCAGTQDKGVFIAALEEALAAGEVDCAVHSLKDMPGTLDDRFEIAAFLPRAPLADVLLVKQGADMDNLLVGTSSARRARLVQCYWGGRARSTSIRGNVATRIRKLVETPEMGAILLARAGLSRLGYPETSFEVDGVQLTPVELSLTSFMPALGQGAIAIEIRRGDERARQLVAAVNDPATSICVRCERAFLDALKADCSVPVGGFATVDGDRLFFQAIYFDGEQPIRITKLGSAADPEALGEEACALLAQRRR